MKKARVPCCCAYDNHGFRYHECQECAAKRYERREAFNRMVEAKVPNKEICKDEEQDGLDQEDLHE